VKRFGVPKVLGARFPGQGGLIANIGGKNAGIVAFDAKTGKVTWTATSDAASYSSGVAATVLGKRYALFLTRAGLDGPDPADGQVRFQRPGRARQAAS
jgi:outer membrane protein assembly factor BamB